MKTILHYKILLLVFVLSMLSSCENMKHKPNLEVSIDLINVIDDKVKVTISLQNFIPKSNYFFLPEIIPGTYTHFDYGQYVQDVVARDSGGNKLKVERKDDNTWYISDIEKLHEISYWVDDILEREKPQEQFYGKKQMLATFGTNFEKEDNFLLNLQAIIGYFSENKELPYQVQIHYPKKLKAASLWKDFTTETLEDSKSSLFHFDRYFSVIDNPILISDHKSTSFIVEDLEIEIVLFSKSQKRDIEDIKNTLQDLFNKQKNYLGDIVLPKKYTIILYETPSNFHPSLGALEHYTGTQAIFSDQMKNEDLSRKIKDVMSHEFLHLLTPLQLHSEYVHNFAYNNPKNMSQHLWLYEGVTEYFSDLYQVHKKIITKDNFYKRLVGKYYDSKAHSDSIPLTVLSTNILRKPYANAYNNFYAKATLTAMALDIRLRENSNGSQGLLDLVKKLAKKYGEKQPFNDATFFEEIAQITDSDIQNFLTNHIQGTTPIPYKDIYKKVGLRLEERAVPTEYFLHTTNNLLGVYLHIDPNERWIIGGMFPMNDWQKKMGLKVGDVLLAVNNNECKVRGDIFPIIRESYTWKNNQDITIKILRDEKEILLKGKTFPPKVNELFLVEDTNTSKKSIELRNNWLYN